MLIPRLRYLLGVSQDFGGAGGRAGLAQLVQIPAGHVRGEGLPVRGLAEKLHGGEGLDGDVLGLEHRQQLRGDLAHLGHPALLQQKHRQLQGGQGGVQGDPAGQKLPSHLLEAGLCRLGTAEAGGDAGFGPFAFLIRRRL
jgi:hypothetical protein